MGDIQLSNLEDGELYIATDFAATLNLRAGETLNCTTDGHAVVCNFVCLHHRVVRVKVTNENEQDGESDDIVVYLHR
jgi:hypothetical protein